MQIELQTDSEEFVRFLRDSAPPGISVEPLNVIGMVTQDPYQYVGLFLLKWGPGIAQGIIAAWLYEMFTKHRRPLKRYGKKIDIKQEHLLAILNKDSEAK